jgi:hypothetical protein
MPSSEQTDWVKRTEMPEAPRLTSRRAGDGTIMEQTMPDGRTASMWLGGVPLKGEKAAGFDLAVALLNRAWVKWYETLEAS